MSDKVPEGWGNYELQKLVQNYKGSIVDGPFGSNLKTSDYVSSGVPVLQGKNVTNDRFVWSDVRYITFEKAEELKRSSVRVGDILMVKIGSVGYSAIVEDLNGFDYAIIPANLLKISLDEEKSLTQFVYQFLISPEGKRRIVEAASSTAQPALSLGAMKKFKIPTPPLPEQQKITSILTSVDEVIENTQQQIDKLQDLKKAIMNELLTKGIGHTEFKDSELGRIPKSWEVKKLKELTSGKFGIVDGPFGSNLKTEHYRKSGVPVIQSGFVTSGKFVAKNYVYVDRDKYLSEIRSAVSGGDIVMAKIGAQAGKCAIMPKTHPVGILSGNSLKISANEEILDINYLRNVFTHLYSIGEVQNLRTETAQPAITIAKLKNYKIKLPSVFEQKKIGKTINSIDAKIEIHFQKLSQTQSLKKSLMQALLTGKVRVQVN